MLVLRETVVMAIAFTLYWVVHILGSWIKKCAEVFLLT